MRKRKKKIQEGMDTLGIRDVRHGFYVHMDGRGQVKLGNDCIGMQSRWVKTNRGTVVTWLRSMLFEKFEQARNITGDDPNAYIVWAELDTLAYCFRALQRRRFKRKPIDEL